VETLPPCIVVIEPHPDDWMLSICLPVVDSLAKGLDVHLVSMTRGEAGGPLGQFNGEQMCTWHGIRHNPEREGYAPLTATDIAELRIAESRAALGAVGAITPNPGVAATGRVFHHVAGLPDGFGGQAGAAPLRAGIDAAKAKIVELIEQFPNAFYYTMSPTEAIGGHPDHAACGIALRELQASAQYGPLLRNAKFFVSKRYWGPPRPAHIEAEVPQWFVAGRIYKDGKLILDRKPEFDALLRKMAAPCYGAWNPVGLPAKGAAGVGYHQVKRQFDSCFAPTVAIGNLWHD